MSAGNAGAGGTSERGKETRGRGDEHLGALTWLGWLPQAEGRKTVTCSGPLNPKATHDEVSTSPICTRILLDRSAGDMSGM